MFTHGLIAALMPLVGAGHTRNFDASSLRKSAKSTLVAHVLALTSLVTVTLGIKCSPVLGGRHGKKKVE